MNQIFTFKKGLSLLSAFFVAFLLMSTSSVAFGQAETTGSLTGTVVDASGARVPGATIKVEGGAFNRTLTADGDGYFRVLLIPPGLYKVTASAANFSTAVVENVEVILGKATPLEFSLKAGSIADQVNISADDVVRIDPADNKIQTNINAKVIDALPKGTNMTSLLKVSPAARPEANSGGFQVDGASGSENSFIIDGQEVSNFRTGVLNANNNLPFQFVQEVQVKTSGFEAEFGGATGGVINVVTKGGSNEFHGLAEMQFEPNSLSAGPRGTLLKFRSGSGATFSQTNSYYFNNKDNFHYYYPAFGIGGPIKKDRIWFFTSYAPQIFDTKRTSNYYTLSTTGAITPNPTYAAQNYHTKLTQQYWQNRIDVAPFNNLRLSATYLWNPIVQRGVIPQSNYVINGVPPTVNFGGSIGTLTGNQLTDRQGGRQNSNNITTQAVWTPKSNLVTSFRFSRGFLNEKLNSYFIPQQTRFTCSGITNSAVPASSGCFAGFSSFPSNSGINFDVSTRRTFEGDITYILNRLAGRHEMKGGYQNQNVTNDVSRGYVPYGVVQLFYGYSINDLTGRDDADTPGVLGAGQVVRFGTVGKASNRAQSIYLQDRWQPINRLSLNIGVRFEKENLPSFNGYAPPINFGWGDKIVPRLGMAYDITGDGKTKVFASYGQFTDRLKFELPRGSFGGDFYRVDYFEIQKDHPEFSYYTLARILGNNQDVLGGKCPIANSSGLTRCQYDYRIASNNPNATIFDGKVDPNMNPFRQTEFTGGVERELSSRYVLSARYSYKNVNWAIEDAGFPTADGSEAYIIGNPGSGLHAQVAQQFGYAKTIKPQRRYDALEIKLDRRLANNYFYNVAYTYSRLYGNYSGLASSDEAGRTSPGVNRFFDLPHLGFTAAGTPDNGRLATDRPHVFNAYGGYNFNWFEKLKSQSTQFSFFQTFQSGTPRTSFYTLYAASVLYGRGNLGRTPHFEQTDFFISHRYKITERHALSFDFNVLNLFNKASVLAMVDNPAFVNPSLSTLGLPSTVNNEPKAINYILTNGITANVDAYLNSTANPQRKDTALGLGSTFQGGRSIRFGARWTF